MTKNKTLSKKKYAGFCYLHEDVKECFDRIKKKCFIVLNDEYDSINVRNIINEEIGDDLK